MTVSLQKMTTVEEIAVKEEMVYVNHSLAEENIIVGTKLYNSKEEAIKEDTIVISGAIYSGLVEIKQEIGFTESDLWAVIDQAREN